MTDVQSIDPRNGTVREVVTQETTGSELEAACERARSAFGVLREHDRAWRAELLRTMADRLEERREDVVATADAETALGETRLNGELTRTCFQLRMFADVVSEGSYLEATIDHAGDTAMGPRPDLRRMLVPTGPVAVFGASNFPLAFSVPGGDTASALAAGCPVVVKAHESHPATSQLCGELLSAAADAAGAPPGTVAVVYGREAGGLLVQHPAITAVGFTGSARGGKALMDLVNERPDPIPFYGEMGSINPLLVTAQAAAERSDEIGRGLVGSFTLGVGQFCTKPGLAFVPAGAAGDSVVRAAAAAVGVSAGGVMLNSGIAESFSGAVTSLAGLEPVREVAAGQGGDEQVMPARLLEVDAEAVTPDMVEECFGPVTLVVRYADDKQLVSALEQLPASLTATLHVGADEPGTAEVRSVLEDKAGRIVYNGFPTGVAVSWAQHHGGGWPATNSIHTSVGATSIRRFLRPVAWQNAPAAALPEELREETRGLPRRIDGELVPADGPREG